MSQSYLNRPFIAVVDEAHHRGNRNVRESCTWIAVLLIYHKSNMLVEKIEGSMIKIEAVLSIEPSQGEKCIHAINFRE